MNWIYHDNDVEKRGKLKQVCLQVMSDPAFFPKWYFPKKDKDGKEIKEPAVMAENLNRENIFVHGKPGSICGPTYCNLGTDKVCELMEISYERRKKLFYARAHDLEKAWNKPEVWIVTGADDLYKRCISLEQTGELLRLKEDEAHYWAWCGEVIFAVAGINPDYSPRLKSGHITPIWPTDEKESLTVANIGGYNCIKPLFDRTTFGVKGLTEIRLYKA